MSFLVMHKQCDQCLFSKRRIVSAARAKDVLRDCARRGVHFICHKADDKDVCCRGFFERRSTNLIRIAGRLGLLRFVNPDGTNP
jgi:hypothetical protein